MSLSYQHFQQTFQHFHIFVRYTNCIKTFTPKITSFFFPFGNYNNKYGYFVILSQKTLYRTLCAQFLQLTQHLDLHIIVKKLTKPLVREICIFGYAFFTRILSLVNFFLYRYILINEIFSLPIYSLYGYFFVFLLPDV